MNSNLLFTLSRDLSEIDLYDDKMTEVIAAFMKRIGFYASLPLVGIPSILPNSTEFNTKLIEVMDMHHAVDKNKSEFET